MDGNLFVLMSGPCSVQFRWGDEITWHERSLNNILFNRSNKQSRFCFLLGCKTENGSPTTGYNFRYVIFLTNLSRKIHGSAWGCVPLPPRNYPPCLHVTKSGHGCVRSVVVWLLQRSATTCFNTRETTDRDSRTRSLCTLHNHQPRQTVHCQSNIAGLLYCRHT